MQVQIIIPLNVRYECAWNPAVKRCKRSRKIRTSLEFRLPMESVLTWKPEMSPTGQDVALWSFWCFTLAIQSFAFSHSLIWRTGTRKGLAAMPQVKIKSKVQLTSHVNARHQCDEYPGWSWTGIWNVSMLALTNDQRPMELRIDMKCGQRTCTTTQHAKDETEQYRKTLTPQNHPWGFMKKCVLRIECAALYISLSPLWHAIVEKSMRILAWSLILILRRSQGDTTYSQNASCQTESHFCILPSSTRHSARVTGRHSFINIGIILRTFYELHSTMLEHSLKVLTQFEVSKSFLVDWTVQNWTETVNAISQPCYVSNALLKPWRPCCVSGRHSRHWWQSQIP